MKKATEIVLCCELSERGLNKSTIARQLSRDRETIRFWLRGVERVGLKSFIDQNAAACRVPRPARQVDALVKIWVWQIREHDCCGQKIAHFLELEHGVKLSVPKIYEVLAEKIVIRSKWKKNQARGEAPAASAPRQVVPMDSIDFGGVFAFLVACSPFWWRVRLFGGVFNFTAVDIVSREADVLLRPALTTEHGTDHRTRCGFPASLHEAALQPLCNHRANRWRQ